MIPIQYLMNFHKMKIKVLLFLNLFFAYSSIQGQTLYLSDCFRGGVVGDGYTAWYTGGVSNIQLPIPSGAVVKQAYLFANIYKYETNLIDAPDKVITINGNPLILKEDNWIGNHMYYPTINCFVKTISIDISNYISPANSNYLIDPLNNGNSPVIEPLYSDYYILVLYENNSMQNTCIEVYMNTHSPSPFISFQLNLKNTPNYLQNICLALHTNGICDQQYDWYNISLNSNLIGSIGGQESNTVVPCAGVIGSFQYLNGTLIGLGNDTSNNTMHGLDAIAVIEGYLNFTNNILLEFVYNSNISPKSNWINQIFLAYTSPCDTFSVTHTSDTTVCQGAQLPLFVTGGQTYEWTPQIGLSCYDCPNPVFTADSTMHYSIRIWNNDSCSKVLPLHIVVEEALPHFNFDISPSECGDSTGSITITPALSGFSYINQTTQDTNSTGIFSGLESGFYPISIVNNSACSFDTVVFIPETLSVHAGFIASPNAGISPLPVAFTNTSSHANSYQWIYENQTSNQENINHIFQQDGIYPVMLIAYGNSILCADTAYDTIYVYLPIEVEIPNIFTPNSDQNNDQWGIKINVLAEADVQIFNRWGEVVLHKKEDITAPGFIPLWDGGEHVGGVYYYVLRLKTDFEKKEFKGNITLVR